MRRKIIGSAAAVLVAGVLSVASAGAASANPNIPQQWTQTRCSVSHGQETYQYTNISGETVYTGVSVGSSFYGTELDLATAAAAEMDRQADEVAQ